ncbi:MAG TPA: YeeE/YedE thiosulfate transporter family protein [Lacipirellulaceae bacterium]|nr:YeeE/YedE thiosulfate transporter family protein [Lacipirellulaceae bacterium]
MSEKKPTAAQSEPNPGVQLALGFLFGIVFGFLLQKGGVAKYHILIGVLLLEDLTVIKVMLSAIIVGMVGIFAMHRLGMIELQLKPTRYAANVLGGLIFGVGFALIGYCPGTGAAALGQGNYDAIGGVLGLMAGSFLYAEASAALSRSVEKWGDRGKMTLPEMVGISPNAFVLVFAPLLALALVAIEQFSSRR